MNKLAKKSSRTKENVDNYYWARDLARSMEVGETYDVTSYEKSLVLRRAINREGYKCTARKRPNGIYRVTKL